MRLALVYQLVRCRTDLIPAWAAHDHARQSRGDPPSAWNASAGGGSNYYFYRKGVDVVVTKANGEFVTILKGGVQNSWYQGATLL